MFISASETHQLFVAFYYTGSRPVAPWDWDIAILVQPKDDSQSKHETYKFSIARGSSDGLGKQPRYTFEALPPRAMPKNCIRLYFQPMRPKLDLQAVIGILHSVMKQVQDMAPDDSRSTSRNFCPPWLKAAILVSFF